MKSSVDAVVMRDHRVFAYGWIFAPTSAIADMRLQVTLTDGTDTTLPVSRGRERADVAQVFPEVAHARYCGWMTYAAWAGGPATSLALVGTLEDGSDFIEPVVTPAVPLAVQPVPSLADRIRARLVRLGRWLTGRPPPSPPPARAFGAPAGEPAAKAVASVQAALRSAGRSHAALVIDHDMGGGANHFRREWMDEQRVRTPVILLLSFDIPSLRYIFEVQSPVGRERLFFADDGFIELLAASGLVDVVFYNDAVSFPQPGDVPGWLLPFKRRSGVRLIIAIHDYFAVCPSQFLLNDRGQFCRIPDVSECMRCLPRNDNEFSSLFPARSIPAWRQRWGLALAQADAIVCFSQSSIDLLLRAYPSLAGAPLRLQPHVVAPFARMPKPPATDMLHIGVVGAIGMHKGAAVLQALAREIAARGSQVKISVIGSVDLRCDPSVLSSTGPFQRDALPELIEQSGANLFLMPSICPETFSYVTQELMSLGVPLACFDFGAPAERVATYPLGLVVPWHGGAELLDALQQFHHRLHAAAQSDHP